VPLDEPRWKEVIARGGLTGGIESNKRNVPTTHENGGDLVRFRATEPVASGAFRVSYTVPVPAGMRHFPVRMDTYAVCSPLCIKFEAPKRTHVTAHSFLRGKLPPKGFPEESYTPWELRWDDGAVVLPGSALLLTWTPPVRLRAKQPGDMTTLSRIHERSKEAFRYHNRLRNKQRLAPIKVSEYVITEQSVNELREARVIVAIDAFDRPIGFALSFLDEDRLHLEQMSVIPEYQRRGIGQRLVEAVLDRASSHGLRAVTLITYRDVPWNAPMYKKHGFEEKAFETLDAAEKKLWQQDADHGFGPDQRVFMTHELQEWR
jgi:GNAT superfamily N-acetyltransferase